MARHIPSRCGDAADNQEQGVKDGVYARLMDQSELDPETECWVFTGTWYENGVGKISVKDRKVTVVRAAAWVFFEGFDLQGPEVVYHCKECPNPACWNPEHLRRASGRTEAFNILRAMGRWGKGSAPKLDPARAALIRLQATTMSRREIRLQHGIGEWCLRAVLNHQTYAVDVGACTGATGATGGGTACE